MARKEYKAGWMRGQAAVDHARRTGAQLWEYGTRISDYSEPGSDVSAFYVRAPEQSLSPRAEARRRRSA